MTLTMTIVTSRCVYQSADYRLVDVESGRWVDFETQKIVFTQGEGWSASIAMSGVGRTPDIDVSEWLADRTKAFAFGLGDPFEDLIERLLEADDWLSTIAQRDKARHSFAVGAFVGSTPTFILISNFETSTGIASAVAAAKLTIYRERPRHVRVFASGQRWAVPRAERRKLAALAARDPDPSVMLAALAGENRLVAERTDTVSSACFTTFLRVTGEGGAQPHGLEGRPFFPSFAMPSAMEPLIRRLVQEQFGPQAQPALTGFSTGRFDATDEFHEIQLREKPRDPSVHSNYGAYLKDEHGDPAAAEREYRIALELDPQHVNALGNLGNLLAERGQQDDAVSLYEKALKVDPGSENVTWNYARQVLRSGNHVRAAQLLDAGLAAHPDSGRLHLLRAELHLLQREPDAALQRVNDARQHRADQSATEVVAAFALHLSGRPIGECVGAYRVALSLSPDNASLRLNLAQLLFVLGDNSSAKAELREAIRLGLDEGARMEAQFYRIAHTEEVEDAIRAIEDLLKDGARLEWDVQTNIDMVAQTNPRRAEILVGLVRVMKGEEDLSRMSEIARLLVQER